MVERLRGARPLLGLPAHRVGERLEPFDLVRLPGRELGPPLGIAFARGEILRIGTAVLDEHALVDVQHARDRLVEQLEVVTDHEEAAAEGAQELHEPLLGVDVEVVRGLVEEQEVAAGEEDARELHAPALAARQRGDGQVEPVGAEAEAGRDPPDLRIGRVAAGVAEGILGVAVGADVAGRCVVGHAAVQLVEAAAGGVEAASRQHVRECGPVEAGTLGRRVLREVPDLARARDHTVRGGRLAREHLQERCLPHAVAAHQADLVAGAQRERGAGQRVPATHFDGEIAHLEHR